MFAAALALSIVPLVVIDQDVKALRLTAPGSVAEIDTGKMKGEPTQLAWSPDGTSFFLQTSERDRLGMIRSPRFFMVPAAGGKPESLKAAPDWAAEYWAWKAHKSAPGAGSFQIDIVEEQKTESATSSPMGGALARGGGTDPTAGTTMDDAVVHAQQTQKQRVITLRLKNEIVGQFINQQFLPGYTFGWAPRGAMIAYGNEQGHLAIMDQTGNKQEVGGTKAVLLPAWSPDGTKIAFLQRAGKNKYELCVVPVAQ
jgi:dipeptidyl aminopeptidase/acylaminoacyl peptidase